MAAGFLAELAAAGRTVVTVLRADQYAGLGSFSNVGAFVPLQHDRTGQLVREVAPARFSLPLTDRPHERLEVGVALVRELRQQVPSPSTEATAPGRWDADLRDEAVYWWQAGWVATPTPCPPTEPKLIPIITTGSVDDPAELARTYFHRWPTQENVRWLLPLGLDTNHGYAKTPVANSAVAKRRTALERRLSQAGPATRRSIPAACQGAWGRALPGAEPADLGAGSAGRAGVATPHRDQGAPADGRHRDQPTLGARRAGPPRGGRRVPEAGAVLPPAARAPPALEDLAASERTMYELDDAKDQVMTVCKVALTNLVMWARDQFFPARYAHATWARLAPFFRLPGRIVVQPDQVCVELRPFNDRQLNHDLLEVCARVEAARPHLPDGRRLVLAVRGATRTTLDAQDRLVA